MCFCCRSNKCYDNVQTQELINARVDRTKYTVGVHGFGRVLTVFLVLEKNIKNIFFLRLSLQKNGCFRFMQRWSSNFWKKRSAKSRVNHCDRNRVLIQQRKQSPRNSKPAIQTYTHLLYVLLAEKFSSPLALT